MWPDNETNRDFLNFSGVADSIAEIIVQARGRPISIGVSGAWGVGKSSMIKLVRAALQDRVQENEDSFVFVEFNAWLYQGYDDARAALVEEIGSKLADEGQRRKKGLKKAKELLERVNWLRAAKLATNPLLSFVLGVPPLPLTGTTATGLLDSDPAKSPPKEIHRIRQCFEEILNEMGITLVLLIDDLDRCLPPTTISTLEAMRLFLFLKNTAFVIAADETMIKHAVKSHYNGIDDNRVTNYFDKLIQVPIRVPPLGTQEVRAYMMLLFIDNSSLSEPDKESIRTNVCNQLGQTWRGLRVDRAFMQTTHPELPTYLIAQFDTADRLAPLMATATQIGGNPRLIKRFLNALSIRMAISDTHGVGVDEAVLAKMLLFERCAAPAAYDRLAKAVNNDSEGKARFLKELEEKDPTSGKSEETSPWNEPFIVEWLNIPPRLADVDLRGVLYVSREHLPLITPEDRLSSEGAELLAAILKHPGTAANFQERLTGLPRPEVTVVMDRLLERARQVQEWGAPPILQACIAVTAADPAQGSRLAAFLRERPASQIKPSIVPLIGDQPWAKEVLDFWSDSDVDSTVRAAINRERE